MTDRLDPTDRLDQTDRRDPTERRDRWLFLGSGGLVFLALLVGLAREQHWGQRFEEVQLLAPTAAGLSSGVEVRISGLPVGQVVAMEMQPDAKVRVRLQIADRYRRLIGPRSVASQGVDGFVGDHFIAITPDPQPQLRHRESGSPKLLPYTQPVDIPGLLEHLVETQVLLHATLSKISGLAAKDLPQALADFRTTMGGVHQLSNSLEREMGAVTPQLRRTLQTMDRAGDGASTLMQTTAPVLAPTLQEVQVLARSANRLLKLLLGSDALEPSGLNPKLN